MKKLLYISCLVILILTVHIVFAVIIWRNSIYYEADTLVDRIDTLLENHNDSAIIEKVRLDSMLAERAGEYWGKEKWERYNQLNARVLQMEILSDSAIQEALYQLTSEKSVICIFAGMPRTKEGASPFRGVWYSNNRNKDENYRYINTYDSVYWVGRPDTTGSYSNSVKHKFTPGLMDKDESKRLSDFFLIHNALTQLSKNEWTPYIDYTNYRPKFSFVWTEVTIKRNGLHYELLYAPDYSNREFIDWLSTELGRTVKTEKYYDIGHHWALYTLKNQSFYY